MQPVVDGKHDIRRPYQNETIHFTLDEHDKLVAHPSGVPVDVCKLTLNVGDHLHFDFVPVHIAERLRSCGVMTVEYLGADQARDVHDKQAPTFSLRQFAECDVPVTAYVSHLARSILERYPNNDELDFAAESGAD